MTMFPATNPDSAATRRACDVAGRLGLAASPTFAIMAWIAAQDAPAMPLCAPAGHGLPIGGMTAMYLLMSLFHLSPWLTRIATRRGGATI